MKGSRGSGRIFQRGRRWWIAYHLDGREYRESVGETSPKAEKALRQRMREIDQGKWVEPQYHRRTVAEVVDAYVRHLDLKGAKAMPSHRSYAARVAARFGMVRARGLTTDALHEWVEDLLNEGLARGTAWRAVTFLGTALRLAQKRKQLAQLPLLPEIRVLNVRHGFFERHEAEAVIRSLPDPINRIARFAYLTGWRRGEILHLRWADVERVARVIRLGDSKSGEARVLPLVGELWELIERQWAARVVGDSLCPWVFHRKGKPVKDFSGAWRAACQKAGVPGKLFHDFRRTAARDMVDAGYDAFTAMQITGHKTLSMFQRYKIVDVRRMAEAMAGTAAHRASGSAGTVSTLGTRTEHGQLAR